jgi:2-oxoglutarate ferredoxin oxidoreductase subunit gamma
MGFRYDVCLSGSGGQGLILMGIILAEAAGIYDDRYVVQTQSYGPEARGGSSKAEIVISDEEIDYPKTMMLDLLLAMNQKSCDDYYKDLKPEGILIVDSTLVDHAPASRVYRIPFTRIAREELKREVAANIIALGAITKLTRIVTPKAVEKAILARMPKDYKAVNLEALNAGMAAAVKVRRQSKSHAISSERENEDT